MARWRIVLGAGLLALGGCSHASRPVVAAKPVPAVTSPGWNSIASAADAERVAGVADLWTRARAAVPARLQARLRAEGALAQPDAALALPTLPPGPYRCRLLRFGGRAGLRSFAPDFCYVDGDATALSFTKQTGSILPGGWLHADTPTRLVFLGATRRVGEAKAPGYGIVPAQDVAGVVERVAPFRWRMVMLHPRRDALLDVYELVPVTPTTGIASR